MTNELHAVVKLLLARMESHPEEFSQGLRPQDTFPLVRDHTPKRWDAAIETILSDGNEAEIGAIQAALRAIRLASAHEYVMDELYNGEERRRKRQEDQENQRLQNITLAQKHAMLARQQTYDSYQQAMPISHSATTLGSALNSTLSNDISKALLDSINKKS